MQVDLRDAKGPDAIPAGWYKGTVESATIVEAGPNAKNAGTPMLKVAFRVDEGEAQGRFVFQNGMLDPSVPGSHRTKKWLEDLEVPTFGIEAEEICEKMAGLECWAKVSMRKRTGEQAEEYGEFQNGIVSFSLVDPNQEVEGGHTVGAHTSKPNGRQQARPVVKTTTAKRREARS